MIIVENLLTCVKKYLKFPLPLRIRILFTINTIIYTKAASVDTFAGKKQRTRTHEFLRDFSRRENPDCVTPLHIVTLYIYANYINFIHIKIT